MSIYGDFLNIEEDVEIDYLDYVALSISESCTNDEELEACLETFGASFTPQVVKDIKDRVSNVSELKRQWKKLEDNFKVRKTVVKSLDEKSSANLHKWYDDMKDEEISYANYKKSFKNICSFFGLPSNKTILEVISFKKHNGKETVELRYSSGLAKVYIPENIELIHASPIKNITALEPTFRSRTKGKFLYPNKRCYFTAHKAVNGAKASMHGKTYKYTLKTKVRTAYIDPACSNFKDGAAVFIPSDNPIPVIDLVKKGFKKVIDSVI